ncbi:MAG: hypothetical protein O3A55_04975 [Bacteroidetes bacterium]|nr:hypothetical protein [Bacteroidota bacterium]
MAEYKGFEFLDLLIFFAKLKNKLLVVFLASLLFAYGFLYFFVNEEFEANAVIIPRGDELNSGIGSVMNNLKKGIPISFGSSTSAQVEINRYNTIIYSRTTLEGIIKKYNLISIYKIDSSDEDAMERAIRRIRKKINTKENNNDAFEIIVRSKSPQLSADIANSLVAAINDKIIGLEVTKSKESRIFLEKRVEDIREELRKSEDSLRAFQETSGLIDLKNQMAGLFSVYSELETNLITRQLKKSILEKLYSKDHPEVKSVEIQITEYQKKLDKIRSEDDPGSVVLAIKNIPQKSAEYLRRFRNVEINNAILEFIIPLYEQAKIEEKKDFPILQVIDYAIAPKTSSFPRIYVAIILSFFITSLLALYEFLRDKLSSTTNPKIEYLKQEFRFTKK